MRVAIAGPPTAGKTHLSREWAKVCHGDDHISLGWSECSDRICRMFEDPAIQCFEGVQIPRALKKWLATHTGKPVDKVIFIRRPRSVLTPQQRNMHVGIRSVWAEIEPKLRARGVLIEVR